MALTDQQIEDYARELILDHAKDVEYLSVFEVWDEHSPGVSISEPDALRVHSLIQQAVVTVAFPEQEQPDD
jgi:hypothetical protein